MTIKLFNNTSPANYVTKQLTEVATLTGNLLEPSSIVDPTIIIERNSPVGFNYFQIPEFNRYYFLTGVSSDSRNLVAISGHCDVLMSYANQIKASNAILRRNEFLFNLYLDDGIFKAYQNTKHKQIMFPKEFNEFSFILALAGNS